MVRETALEGGCLCGAVRFRVVGTATNRCCCHCRSCRLASGAPFVAWATFPHEGFAVTRGALAAYRSSPQVERGHCAACGSALTYRSERSPGEIDVAVATLDEPSEVVPEDHIWVSHKLAWVETGALPCWPEERGADSAQGVPSGSQT